MLMLNPEEFTDPRGRLLLKGQRGPPEGSVWGCPSLAFPLASVTGAHLFSSALWERSHRPKVCRLAQAAGSVSSPWQYVKNANSWALFWSFPINNLSFDKLSEWFGSTVRSKLVSAQSWSFFLEPWVSCTGWFSTMKTVLVIVCCLAASLTLTH